MSDQDILAENAFLDAQDIALDLGRDFVDSDILQYRTQGIDLYSAALWFYNHYTGSNRFVNSLKQFSRPPTQPQARVLLNIMRREMLGLSTTVGTDLFTSPHCFECKEQFLTWDELRSHKIAHHSAKPRPAPVAESGEAVRVVEVQTSKLGLDLSQLPDGRYAAPDPSGKNEYIYLMVKRVRRTVKRDRRYVYGKIITGNEIVVAGTIEVKIWSSDSKELIGEQKPGEVYRGKYEDELQLIMIMPQIWAQLFGKLVKKCCICGKTLTDDISQQIGMGIECEKKEFYFKQPPKYSFIGDDRPDKWRANPFDKEYLAGRRTFMYFKPVPPAGHTENSDDDNEED